MTDFWFDLFANQLILKYERGWFQGGLIQPIFIEVIYKIKTFNLSPNLLTFLKKLTLNVNYTISVISNVFFFPSNNHAISINSNET